ncbi:uncharacterized protein LOC144634017 [Oculina patagonica]
MLLKFITIAIATEVLLPQAMASSVNASCPHWVQLNKSPVSFGAKGNSFGKFTYNRNVFVSSFMLVHRSGTVSCWKTRPHFFSYWGCLANSTDIRVVLTDEKNKKLAPSASLHKYGGYTLEGYTSSSSILVFCAPKKPHCVFANSELRLWYGEDFLDYSEGDNAGKTCADVYGLLV